MKITVASQQRVESKSGNPFANREVKSAIRNNGRNAIFIYGFKSKHGFFPSGLLARLDEHKNIWVRPDGTNVEYSDEAFKDELASRYVLRPGRSTTFTDLAESFYVGNKFQRILYISTGPTEKPKAVNSPTFILG